MSIKHFFRNLAEERRRRKAEEEERLRDKRRRAGGPYMLAPIFHCCIEDMWDGDDEVAKAAYRDVLRQMEQMSQEIGAFAIEQEMGGIVPYLGTKKWHCSKARELLLEYRPRRFNDRIPHWSEVEPYATWNKGRPARLAIETAG